ncbi:HlyD family efflux transporter periplasmic adaptor subunit [Clostridium aestuarii]|uniref:HlyD family efflux transporter periplasmic adaptor subunit n=1 Tax=Clostridium aestuarii TaxID=338193 RepID=A0ABT4CY03_9CLOT|nr:HlyD family efflux transporter periplasmic adaptor subunit [Clostridium aestuarii]MCY6483876.1 HlyD family efflux transporter periplasmic adaptor subunit [Clostridium aestuarii]
MANVKKDKKRKKHGKIIIGIIIAAIAMSIIFILPNRMRNNIENSYKTETMKKRDIVNYYSFSGVVESKNRENIIAKEMMQIKEIVVKEGDKVKKDDVVIKASNNIKIKADIDGEISKIYLDENAQVLGGTKLVDIVDYDNLQVSIKVDEYDISSIKIAQEVDVYIDSIGKMIKGVITKISREATNINGVSYFTANIDLQNDKDVRVGMNAESKMLNEKAENVLTLSIEALQFNQENEPYVFIKGDKGIPTEREIKVGINDGLFVEIKSGISSEEIVMIPKKATNSGGEFRPPFAGGNK